MFSLAGDVSGLLHKQRVNFFSLSRKRLAAFRRWMTYSFYIVVPYVFFTMNRMVFSFLFLPPRMGKEKRGEKKRSALMRCCCWIAGVFVHVRRGLASYTFFFFISGGEVWDGREKKKKEGLRLSEELSRAGDGAACCCRLDVSARARNISLAALPPCVTCRAHPYSTRLHIDSFTPFTKKKKERRWPRFYRRGRAEIEREREEWQKKRTW